MTRTLAFGALVIVASLQPAAAQDYLPQGGAQPVQTYDGPPIETQPLPPPAVIRQSDDMAPTRLTPSQPQTVVSPHEGPEERSLDRSLGLGAGASDPRMEDVPSSSASPVPDEIKPSPKEDALIEQRINAAANHPGATDRVLSPPGVLRAPAGAVPQQTTIVGGGSTTHPSTTAPAPTHWEGPEERALDQAAPGYMSPQQPPGSVDPEDAETHRLNGGY